MSISEGGASDHSLIFPPIARLAMSLHFAFQAVAKDGPSSQSLSTAMELSAAPGERESDWFQRTLVPRPKRA